MLKHWDPAFRGQAPRLAGFAFLLLTLSATACGVPISAVEMTATAENGGGHPSALLSVQKQPSQSSSTRSLEVPATSLTATPRPLATATPRTTGTPPATVSLTPSATASVTGTPRPSGTSSPPQPAASGISLAQQAVKILNDMRVERGLRPLAIDPKLASGSEAYAKLLADKDAFSHTGPDGSTPQSRFAATGYRGSWKGECLSAGQQSPLSAIESWRDSPSHAAIIFEPTSVDVGIGLYFDPGDYYGTYWVLMAGAP